MEVPPHFKDTPLAALRNKTRDVISNCLNQCKILLSPEGFRRDYRGLANAVNVSLPPINCLDPTGAVVKNWEKANNPSLSDFIATLQLLDRWDVLEDTLDLIKEDALLYSKRTSEVVETNNVSLDSDLHILTVSDVVRMERGLGIENYDAFLLYSDDDAEFASRVMNELEGRYNLKLCVKDRDLVGGVTFEHEAVMRLISERCNRLIIIVSPSFIESSANKFFVNYAQALGIEQRQRKIVPCIYKKVVLPRELRYYFFLDYTRSSPLWDFWEKLSQSIRAPEFNGYSQARALPSSVTVTELPPEPLPPSSWDPKKTSAVATVNTVSEGASALPAPADVEVSQKKKSRIRELVTNLFPKPPSDKPGKRLFKKDKKKVKLPAS